MTPTAGPPLQPLTPNPLNLRRSPAQERAEEVVGVARVAGGAAPHVARTASALALARRASQGKLSLRKTSRRQAHDGMSLACFVRALRARERALSLSHTACDLHTSHCARVHRGSASCSRTCAPLHVYLMLVQTVCDHVHSVRARCERMCSWMTSMTKLYPCALRDYPSIPKLDPQHLRCLRNAL